MPAEIPADLPIQSVLAELRLQLLDRDELVLQAAPGAGKTTVVPLALLEAAWLQGRKILMLEPRRMAARTAAMRMASMLGETVGETVGYRVRLDTRVGEQTRIEVVTEGVLTRMLQSDPALSEVGLVIFDECHERSLDSDLGLALVLQARQVFRDAPLKVIAMSATLDDAALSTLLNAAPVVSVTGRQHPIAMHWGQSQRLRDSIVEPVVMTTMRALRAHEGSVLVFLPGHGEILRVRQQLVKRLAAVFDEAIEVLPLFGGLSLEAQQQAMEPAPAGHRKVVLSTNIAETSLTIDGIETVIDCGLVREAIFDSSRGMQRLVTRRVSRAAADQRAGRAGRLGPGHCYRLWSAEQHLRLAPQSTPEIKRTDLTPLALQLLAWGASGPEELSWLDPPPQGPYEQAIALLRDCGAVFENAAGARQLAPHGVRMAQLPLHPRLAHMLLVACDIEAVDEACRLAALLSVRNPLARRGTDLEAGLAIIRGAAPCPDEYRDWHQQILRQADRFRRQLASVHTPRGAMLPVRRSAVTGVLIASAYPERIARLRQDDSDGGCLYQLANGRLARLPADDRLAGNLWLAVAEIEGREDESEDRIYRATPLDPALFASVLSPMVSSRQRVEWNLAAGRFHAEREQRVGSLVIHREPLTSIGVAERSAALLEAIAAAGLDVLPWTRQLRQWQARVCLLRNTDLGPLDDDSLQLGVAAAPGADNNPWPDLSDETLLATLEQWLLPHLAGVETAQQLQSLKLKAILHGLLPWPLPLELERLAPERLAVPSGANISIDYLQSPPVLAVRLQDMFGCSETPRVGNGRIALMLHLLSPAQRPLQITQDLSGFWAGSYQEVRKEMRGRYPKHDWPEDPASATPGGQLRSRRA